MKSKNEIAAVFYKITQFGYPKILFNTIRLFKVRLTQFGYPKVLFLSTALAYVYLYSRNPTYALLLNTYSIYKLTLIKGNVIIFTNNTVL